MASFSRRLYLLLPLSPLLSNCVLILQGTDWISPTPGYCFSWCLQRPSCPFLGCHCAESLVAAVSCTSHWVDRRGVPVHPPMPSMSLLNSQDVQGVLLCASKKAVPAPLCHYPLIPWDICFPWVWFMVGAPWALLVGDRPRSV